MNDLKYALVRTFIARAFAALGALGLLFVVGRIYGPVGVGVMALAQAILLGSGLLARGGMDNALMRYVGQKPSYSHSLLYLRWALVRGISAGLLISVLLVLFRGWLETFFESPGLSAMLLGIAFSVPAYVAAFLLSGFFKGVRMPATACLMENGSVALFAACFLAVWHRFFVVEGYAVIGWVYLMAVLLVVLQGAVQLWCWSNRNKKFEGIVEEDLIDYEQFRSTSRAFFVTTFAGFMQSVLAVMIAGWLLVSADLGLFKSSQQLGMLIAFILVVINAIFPPRFAALYHQGEIGALSRLARQGAVLGIVAAMPLMLLCLIFPAWVLGWFGDGFTEAAPLLRVIALAQFVNVATGSVSFLLNMTGHEKLIRNIALLCNALGLVGFWVLIPLFGPIGAALALAFVLVVQNLVALFYVWRVLGIWTLPGPNALAFLGVKTKVERS